MIGENKEHCFHTRNKSFGDQNLTLANKQRTAKNEKKNDKDLCFQSNGSFGDQHFKFKTGNV